MSGHTPLNIKNLAKLRQERDILKEELEVYGEEFGLLLHEDWVDQHSMRVCLDLLDRLWLRYLDVLHFLDQVDRF